jgi:paraquat-inducible protein B
MPMSGSDPSGPVPEAPPPPTPGGWTALPWVWAVPIVALLIAGWLGYRALAERGPTITISFATAEGIEADRTPIRYKDVELGRVIKVGLTPDRSRALVTAAMTRAAEPLLRADNKFWVVRPRIGLSGVSGLTTVLSGPYIGMLPGTGAPGADSFAGLETPPPQQGLVKGKSYTLVAKRLAEISDQSPVYYHGVQVGEVTGHQLSDRDGTVAVHVFIYSPHQALIHPDSRFWVASGLNVSIGAEGVKVATAPLLTIVAGGIVFDTPDEALASPPSPPGSTFPLYADETTANEAAELVRVQYRLYFPGSVSGVDVGTPVDLRGLPIGEVIAVRLEYDPVADTIREPVTIEVAPHRIKVGGHRLDAVGPDPVAAMNKMFAQLVKKGLRAQLVSANLLTGQRSIELDFDPDAPPAQVAWAKPYPELPTVESSGIGQVTRSANKLMTKLAALPLDQLVGQIRLMVGHADNLIDRPEVRRSLHNLDLTLSNTERLTRTADVQVGPLLQRLNGAAQQLRATLMILGNDPAASSDLARTLAELTDAARSVRVLADYLERHPESLVSGKPGEAWR